MHKLPSHEVVKDLATEADLMKSRFDQLGRQFANYITDIDKYKEYLQTTIISRSKERVAGNPDNQGNMQQKLILDKINQFEKALSQYTELLS